MRHVRAHLGAVALPLLLAYAGPGLAETPVADAAMRRDAVEVRRLLQGGADVNAAQADGATALHWAAYHGDASLASSGRLARGTMRYGARSGLRRSASRPLGPSSAARSGCSRRIPFRDDPEHAIQDG